MHFSKALVVLFGAFAPTQAYHPEEQVGKYNLHAAGPGCNQNTTIARNLAIIGRCVNLHEEDAEYISVSGSGKVKWYWLGYTMEDCMGATVIKKEMPRDRWKCMDLHQLVEKNETKPIKSIKIFNAPH